MKTKKGDIISLLGCGWLGFPLAKALISEGFLVKGSTTTPARIPEFENAGIDPYLVQFGTPSAANLTNLLNADQLVITIPPGRRDPNGFDNYKQMISSLSRALPGSRIAKVILISSTSVYPDSNHVVDEFSAIAPDTASGSLMAESEGLLQALPVQLIVLRLAGLIGPQRLPGKFFAGKRNIPNGLAPVNLIHLQDAVGLTMNLISDPKASGVYNGSTPDHPSREEFYTLAARAEGLDLPEFIREKTAWKIISSARVSSELAYHYQVPDLLQFLDANK